MVFIPSWCVDGLHPPVLMVFLPVCSCSSSELLGADQGVPQHRRSLQHGLPGGDHRLAADHEPADQPQCALTPLGLSLYGRSPCSYPVYQSQLPSCILVHPSIRGTKKSSDVSFLSSLNLVLRWVVNIVDILCVLFSVYELHFCFNIFNKCISRYSDCLLCSTSDQIPSSSTSTISSVAVSHGNDVLLRLRPLL